ncbi:2-hydroxyglutaryl-CoA dehydratase [bacterium]|nr:2-hydroxyglutaryl-CoA dehydratase [bacterium]
MAESEKDIEKRGFMNSLFAGIDIGSRTGKIVIIDREKKIIHSALLPSTGGTARTYAALLSGVNSALQDRIVSTVATGYGRVALEDIVDKTATEITCHFVGVSHFYPETKTIVDVGGQDSKVITVDGSGRIKDFLMNDRCAAGTGRFLEVMADRLGWSLDELSELQADRLAPVRINATCTVFAESEVVSLLAHNTDVSIIASSVAQMVAQNVFFMTQKLHGSGPFFMSGGVASIKPVVYHLSQLLSTPIAVDDRSALMGAMGAALLNL